MRQAAAVSRSTTGVTAGPSVTRPSVSMAMPVASPLRKSAEVMVCQKTGDEALTAETRHTQAAKTERRRRITASGIGEGRTTRGIA